MAKAQQSRRELIEKMQRDQARSDRRRTTLIVAVSIVVGLGIIAVPAVKLIEDSRAKSRPIAAVGVKAAAASCDAPTNDPAGKSADHRPDGEKIAYAVSPPSSGPHSQTWAPFSKKFYSAEDRPPVENLVHNLEHGYTLLWYSDEIAKDKKQVAEIEKLAKAKLPDAADGGFFIAAPFHASEGAAWPAGKKIAFAHWSAGPEGQSFGHRQFCGALSGEALTTFINKFPAQDTQEPGLR